MEDLRAKIHQALMKSDIDDKSFIPEDQIEKLITRDSLEKCFHLSPSIPIEQMTKVICILISGNNVNADLITGVYESGLTNDYLPVTTEINRMGVLKAQSTDPQKANKTFQAFPSDSHYLSYGYAFEKLQWTVLSPTFGLGKHLMLSPDVVLPIIDCSPEKDGGKGQGSVRKIQVHPAHLRRPSQSQLSREQIPPIALKMLPQNSTQKDFSREQLALHKLQSLHHNHLIELVSSFQRRAYYFLFPWAGGGDLKSFWKDGTYLECRRYDTQIENFPEENGRHGDLKPQNILLFDEDSNGNNPGTLRIADVGLARFHAECTGVRKDGTTTRGETIEYAPPEALDEGLHVKRSRKFDMWSLGCIYLEFITWLIGGFIDVEEFRKKRKISGCKHHEFYKSRTRRHPEVKRHIKRLREDRRCKKGTSFGDLLDVIEGHLLVIDHQNRWNSTELKNKLASILEKARGQGDYLCGPDGVSPMLVYGPDSNGCWPH